MNKWLLLFTLITTTASAQDDVIMLKRHNYTLHTYMSGDVITLKLNDSWLTAYIQSVAHDSVYLRPFTTRVIGGGNMLAHIDTTFGITFPVHPNEIQALPREKSFSLIRNGAIFQIGGGGYLLLNIINTLSDNDPVFGEDNLPNVLIAGGVVALGTVLQLTNKTVYKMNGKYKIAYLHLSKE